MSKPRPVTQVLIVVVMVIISLLILYPVAFVLSGAFSKSNSLASMSIWPVPTEFSLVQFQRLFTKTKYLTWYANTLKVACMNTALTLLVTITTAYVLSRFRFAGKKMLMSSFLILQAFPSFVGMVALYVILWRIGGLNTLWGLVLVYSAGNIPYNSWLIKGYFDNIPRSIDEAARVDGAGHLQIYMKVIVPIARPILMFQLLTSFTGPWMDFIFPRLVLRSDGMKTLAIGLYDMINGRSNDQFTMFSAGSLLVAVPFLIIFVIGQKYMIMALASGAVKE